MYLVQRKSDGLAQYLFAEKPRMKSFLTHPVIALDIQPSTHNIIEVTPPETWAPGAYRYDKGWEIINQEAITDAKQKTVDLKKEAVTELLKIKEDQDGKSLSMSYLDKRLDALEKYLGVI